MSFDYLLGWTVTDDDDLGSGARFVSLDGPNEAVLMLTTRPMSAETNLDEYAASVIENRNKAAARQEYPVGPVSSAPIQAKIAGTEVPGIEQSYTISGKGITLPYVAQLYTVPVAGRKVYVHFQAAVEDLESTRAGVARVFETLGPPSR